MIAKNTCAIHSSVHEGESEIAIIIISDISRLFPRVIEREIFPVAKKIRNRQVQSSLHVTINLHVWLSNDSIVSSDAGIESTTRAMDDPDFFESNRSSRDNNDSFDITHNEIINIYR